MVDSRPHYAFLATFISLIFIGMAVDVSIAAPEATDGAPAPANQAIDESDALKQVSSTALTLVREQSVIQCIELAREAIQRKDFLVAMPLLERVLTEPNSFVPIDNMTEVAAHEEAHRLLIQMPPDLRQRLNEPRRLAASRSWETLRVADPIAVEKFVEQFGDLPIGIDALWWIALSHRDHHRNELAAATFLRVSNNSHANQLQRAHALVAAYESLIDARQIVHATRVLEQLKSFDPKQTLRLRGESQTLGEWISSHRPDGQSADSKTNIATVSTAEEERLLRPVLTPVWKQPLSLPLDSLIATREQKQREQGVKPISILRPLVTRDLVIVRSLDEIAAVDLASGEPRWTIPVTEFANFPDGFFDHPNVHPPLIDWAQLRLCADSLFSRMSADARQLYVLQGPHREGQPKMGSGDLLKGYVRQGLSRNTLCSYSLSSGSLNWEIGDSSNNSDDEYGGLVFLSCPLIIDDSLYVVAQRETGLELLAIHPDSGRLSWSLKFGATLLPIAEDLQRSRVACPITWQDGLLICSTSAGAVVAVDPLIKTIKWAYRYPATTFATSDLVQGPNPHVSPPNHEPWWDAWREPFQGTCRIAREPIPFADQRQVASATTIFIFASPESEQLHAIDLIDGKPLWRIDRNSGALVAGIIENRLIIVEGDFIRGHDTASGRQLWRTTIPEIGGPGVFAGSTLIVTSLSGGTMLVDTRTGRLVSETTSAETTYGSLVEAGSDWVLLSRQNVMRLPRLDIVRREIDEKLHQDAHNESLLVRAAFLDLQAGYPDAARHRLEGLTSNPAIELRRQALIDTLRASRATRPDSERSELVRQLKELAADPDDKFAAAEAIGTSALSVSDFVGAVDALLDGLGSELTQPEGLVKTASVIVRRDRLLLGLIDEALRKASAEELATIDELFSTRVKQAKKSRDRFSIISLIEQWKGLDSSRKLVVQEDERSSRKWSTKLELQLLDAAGSDDDSVARQALNRLAARFDKSDMTAREAFAVRQRIDREHPAENSSGSTDRLQTKRPKSIWPDVMPKAEPPRSDRTFEIFSVVPMEAEPGSLGERLDVWVDRNGNEVLFRGDSFFPVSTSDGREQTFKLPTTVSPYRGPTGYMLRHAWGIGRTVILLVGTELFAITPLDDNGDPNARFLWSIDLQSAPGDTRIVPSAKGNNDSRFLVVDQSNRAIGKVGPVRAGYLCFQKGTKLVAVETDSGRTLWERLDFPSEAVVVADDHRVYIWNDHQELVVLSAVDGRKIEERTTAHAPAAMIHHRDALVWTLTQEKAVQLELHNFRSGAVVWSRTEPPKTQVTVLDAETLGIARPDGEFHIIAARTGAPIAGPLNVKVESLSGIVSWYDTERWYVALTGQSSQLNSLKSLQVNDSYRLKFMTGTLFAVDCSQPKVLWQRELKDEPLALDQSRTSPVLVQLWKMPPKGSELMLRLIDKRTGTVVFERTKEDYSPYYLLNPDSQQGVLEMKLARETIQINYPTD